MGFPSLVCDNGNHSHFAASTSPTTSKIDGWVGHFCSLSLISESQINCIRTAFSSLCLASNFPLTYDAIFFLSVSFSTN